MAAPRLAEKELRRIHKLVCEVGVSAAARKLGRPRSTVQAGYQAALERLGLPDGRTDPRAVRCVRAVRARQPDPTAPAPPPEPPPPPPITAEERREIIRLKADVTRLNQALKEADHARLEADRFRALSRELHDGALPPPDWAVKVPAGADSPGVPMLDLGDWHIGETVDPRQLHGANAFDAAIADARVKRLLDRVLYLAFQHVKAPKYPGIVVILGGDFVSGWLHQELFRTDWCPPTMAANWCTSRLHRVLLRLAEAFGRVWVVAVPGNHGRLTQKPMAKGGAEACFDHAIYEALADRLQDDARFAWSIPAAGDCIVQVAGTRYLVAHGHQLGVKGGDGLIGALGPIMRGTIKTARAERSVGRDFDVAVLHHFHQALWLPSAGIIVNGTLKGYDEWARLNRFAFAPPTQWLWFSHPRFGPNLPFDIRLEEPREARPPIPFAAEVA
jgi:predicted phosphodiesterase